MMLMRMRRTTIIQCKVQARYAGRSLRSQTWRQTTEVKKFVLNDQGGNGVVFAIKDGLDDVRNSHSQSTR